MSASKVRRMWINQPSSLQPLHRYHGTNVLVVDNVAYFLEEDVVSMPVSSLHLSEGWERL